MPEGRLCLSGATLPFDSPAPRNHRRQQGEPHNNLNTASFGASPLSATRRFIFGPTVPVANRPVSLPVAALLRGRSQGSEGRLPIDGGSTHPQSRRHRMSQLRAAGHNFVVSRFVSEHYPNMRPCRFGARFAGRDRKKHGEGFGCVSERRLGPHLRGLTLPFNADSRHGWDRGTSA